MQPQTPQAPMQSTPTQPTANKLTPTLTVNQMMQNIDAMKAQKMQNPQIQDYVNNYEKAGDGTYTLKGSTQKAPAQEAEPSITDKLQDDVSEGAKDYMSDKMGTKQLLGPTKAVLRGTGDIAGEVFKPVGKALDAATGGALSKVFSTIANTAPTKGSIMDKITDNPEVQKIVAEHPNLGEDFTRMLNLIFLGEANGAEPDISTMGERTKAQIKTVTDIPSKMVEATKNSLKKDPVDVAKEFEKSGIQDATPSYDKKMIGQPAIKNDDGTVTSRLSEAKGTGNRTVNSTKSEIEAGKELTKVKGYDPKATSLDKYNVVQKAVMDKGTALEKSLKDEKVLRPPKEVAKLIKTAVNNASENSVLLQKTDPIVKNYLRVAQRAIAQNEGTLSGELSVRKALDRAYDDAGGKYGNNKGLDQIHRAARNALNDDLENQSQTTSVKQSLKEQSNLYKAMDVLQDKAKAEGGSKFEQFAKKHPIITKGVKAVARSVGLGEAVHMATP